MSKLTDKEIEDKIAAEILVVMEGQQFNDFYMAEDPASFVAYIQCDDERPTKEDIINDLKRLFSNVIDKAKEIANAC